MTDERAERLRQRIQRRKQRSEEIDTVGTDWECGIDGCSDTFASVRDLVVHQARDHPPHTCKVCHGAYPEGFLAIYHTFTEHGRTEYMRAYEATPDDVRVREQILESIEGQVDVGALFEEVEELNRSRTM